MSKLKCKVAIIGLMCLIFAFNLYPAFHPELNFSCPPEDFCLYPFNPEAALFDFIFPSVCFGVIFLIIHKIELKVFMNAQN